MALEHRTFAEILRQSYPDDCRRAENGFGASRSPEWGDPGYHKTPEDRRAAIVSGLLDDFAWVRLDDDDRAELIKLAAQETPLADLYNYVDYRMNQTVLWDPVTDRKTRYGVESSWSPLTENGVPERRSPEWEATYRRVSDRISAVDQRAWQRGQAAGPQAPPASRQPGTADGAKDPHAGTQPGRPRPDLTR